MQIGKFRICKSRPVPEGKDATGKLTMTHSPLLYEIVLSPDVKLELPVIIDSSNWNYQARRRPTSSTVVNSGDGKAG